MSDFITSLNEEVERLERALESTPEFQRLKAARDLRDLYHMKQRANGASMMVNTGPQDDARNLVRAHRRQLGSRTAVLEAAKRFVAGRTKPTSTADILEAVVCEGIAVGGTEPRNNLSSLLSRSEEFVSHGRSGWTLARNNEENKETKADDGNGLHRSSSALKDRRNDQPAEPRAQGREAGPGGGT